MQGVNRRRGRNDSQVLRSSTGSSMDDLARMSFDEMRNHMDPWHSQHQRQILPAAVSHQSMLGSGNTPFLSMPGFDGHPAHSPALPAPDGSRRRSDFGRSSASTVYGDDSSSVASSVSSRQMLHAPLSVRGGSVAGEDRMSQLGTYDELLALDDDVVKRGVSDRVIRQMKVSYPSRPSTSSTKCHICLGAFTPNQPVMHLPCKHQFHEDCTIQWFKEHRTCPICRHVIED